MTRILISICLFCIWISVAAQQPLSKEQAIQIGDQLWTEYLQKLKPEANQAWEERGIRSGDFFAKIKGHISGGKPIDGRSLYISLHGGGNAPAEVNDQQWHNQADLYAPKEGVYVALRAPTNTWNLWHENHVDEILDSLIRYMAILHDVNLNKVYVMGYSAGGDGVYQLAPRMADRWAAASMMAGHPGDAVAENLRNLPFAIFMGGKDNPYDRNKWAEVWRVKLDSLQKIDPKAYTHQVTVYPDLPHWMERRDTVAVDWMAQYVRNPLPDKVVWIQDDRLHTHAYWLQARDKVAKVGDKAVVSIDGNEISIHENTYTELYINLNDRLLDLDKPVLVKQRGEILFNGKLTRRESILQATFNTYRDPNLLFSSRLVIRGNQVKIL